MTEAQLIHDWDDLYFCVKCGVSRKAVLNADRERQCISPDNLVPISSRIARSSGALVRAWLAEGADAREHILPVIQQGIDLGMASKINTLSYFTPAIRRRVEDRPVIDRRASEQAPRHLALARAQDAGDDEFEVKISRALRDDGAEEADRLGADYLERREAAR